jgi:hypothetical protein
MRPSVQPTVSHRIAAIFYLIGAEVCVFLVMGIDRFVIGEHIFLEGVPLFSKIYWLRMVWSFVAGFLLIKAITTWTSVTGDLRTRAADDLALDDWGMVTFSLAEPTVLYRFSCSIKKVVVWFVILLSFYFLFLFIFLPYSFNRISKEDGIIESFSAIAAFLACGLFLIAAKMAWLITGKQKLPLLVFIVMMSVLCFFIGMEEVSWFQRTIDFGTPAMFEENIQEEFNLHNFATDFCEIAYYCGGFIWLVLIPFGFDRAQFCRTSHPLSIIIPSRYILVISIIAGAYNFDQWNIVIMQLVFFSGWFILASYWWQHRSTVQSKVYALIWMLYTCSQASFLFFHRKIESEYDWVLTEYREFYIPLALSIYAGEIMIRILRRIKAPPSQLSPQSP